jgi:putative ABC transport system permease protein
LKIGATFGSEGNALISEPNFWRFVPNLAPIQANVGAIMGYRGADATAAQAALQRILPNDVMILTKPELIAFAKDHWANTAPVGFIFGLGVVIGLIVGCVILYQLPFSDISRHIGEYATLKPMGYANGYLARAVMGEALILAIFGSIPS